MIAIIDSIVEYKELKKGGEIMKRNAYRLLTIILSLALLSSACSSSETTEETKKKKNNKKSTTAITEIDDDIEDVENDNEEDDSEPEETKPKITYETHSFNGICFPVPEGFSEFSKDDHQVAYKSIASDCLLCVSAEQVAGADASKATGADFEIYKDSYTEKFSYGGKVIDAGYRETSDFLIWYESTEVINDNLTGLWHINFVIDKETSYAYEFIMMILSTDESVRTEYAEIWSDIEKAIEKDYSFTPPKAPEYRVLVYEDERVKIEFLKADAKGVHFDVENLTDANITIQATTVAINGKSTDKILMSDDIAPHSIGEVVAKCSVDYQNPVGTVSGMLRVIDFNKSFSSYDAIFDSVVIDPSVVIDVKPTGILVFEDERVRIFYKTITSEGVVFEVENLTSANITIQADSISINKRSESSILMSDDIAPHCIGEATAKCSIAYDGTPATISGQLRVIDFNKSFTSYDASFTDIDISGA